MDGCRDAGAGLDSHTYIHTYIHTSDRYCEIIRRISILVKAFLSPFPRSMYTCTYLSIYLQNQKNKTDGPQQTSELACATFSGIGLGWVGFPTAVTVREYSKRSLSDRAHGGSEAHRWGLDGVWICVRVKYWSGLFVGICLCECE